MERLEVFCTICLKVESDSYRFTHDHLIPKLACKDFPKSLGEHSVENLRDLDINLLSLCTKCHSRIDDGDKKGEGLILIGKMRNYRNENVLGLTKYLAIYPRSPSPEALIRQYNQFIKLFSILDVRYPYQATLFARESELVLKKSKKLQFLIESFTKAHELVGVTLYQWQKGDF